MKHLLKSIWCHAIRGALIAILLTALTACASGLAKHSFGFDVLGDSPGMQVLDYRYGDSRISAASADKSRPWPRGYGGTSVTGEMLRGDSLYVRWRVVSTGQTFEDTVDLRGHLPRDITNHEIYFIVKGPQLFVYLITPEKRPHELEANGSRKTEYLKTLTISSNVGREITAPRNP